MKLKLNIVLCLVLALMLSACGASVEPSATPGPSVPPVIVDDDVLQDADKDFFVNPDEEMSGSLMEILRPTEVVDGVIYLYDYDGTQVQFTVPLAEQVFRREFTSSDGMIKGYFPYSVEAEIYYMPEDSMMFDLISLEVDTRNGKNAYPQYETVEESDFVQFTNDVTAGYYWYGNYSRTDEDSKEFGQYFTVVCGIDETRVLLINGLCITDVPLFEVIDGEKVANPEECIKPLFELNDDTCDSIVDSFVVDTVEDSRLLVNMTDEANFNYVVVNKGAIIYRFNSSAIGDFEVPETLGGYPVIGVAAVPGEVTFANEAEMTAITFPCTLRFVCDGMLTGCENLEWIDFGAGLKELAGMCFPLDLAVKCDIYIPGDLDSYPNEVDSLMCADNNITIHTEKDSATAEWAETYGINAVFDFE